MKQTSENVKTTTKEIKDDSDSIAAVWVSNAQLIGESMGEMAAGVEGAWRGMLKNIIGMFIGAMQKVVAANMAKDVALGNWAGVAIGAAQIAGLEALKAGAGVLIDKMGGEQKTETSTTSSGGGGGESRPSSGAMRPSAEPSRGGALYIQIFNPRFLTKTDFDRTIDEIFKTARENGWDIQYSPLVSVV